MFIIFLFSLLALVTQVKIYEIPLASLVFLNIDPMIDSGDLDNDNFICEILLFSQRS